MFRIRRCCLTLLALIFLGGLCHSFAQQFAPKPNAAPDAPTIADIARSYKDKKRTQLRVSPEAAKEILAAVDPVFDFASSDSGLPKHSAVSRRMIGQTDVEERVRESIAKDDAAKQMLESQLSMKKFGLLARDFDLSKFLVKLYGEQIAGFYDFRKKTMFLIDWVPLEGQKPVMAHELTHALQDQNYDLLKWTRRAQSSRRKPEGWRVDNDEFSTARTCVVEGQAMIVLTDFKLVPYGITLEKSPAAVELVNQDLYTFSGDTSSLHAAPLVLKEALLFPYREGFSFEMELLEHGGRDVAFSGALHNPPQTSREILHPAAYLGHETITNTVIPDLRGALGPEVELSDSGAFGELDVRILIQQFSGKHRAASLSKEWRGGSYLAFRRKAASAQMATTADTELVYVSRWSSADSAEEFADFYRSTLMQKYKAAQQTAGSSLCGQQNPCPDSATHFATEEGPVTVQRWKDLVLVTESVAPSALAEVATAIYNANRFSPRNEKQASLNDISLRFASQSALAIMESEIKADWLHLYEQRVPTVFVSDAPSH